MSDVSNVKLNHYLISYNYYGNGTQGSGNFTHSTNSSCYNQSCLDYAKDRIRVKLDEDGWAHCGFVIMSVSFLGVSTMDEFRAK